MLHLVRHADLALLGRHAGDLSLSCRLTGKRSEAHCRHTADRWTDGRADRHKLPISAYTRYLYQPTQVTYISLNTAQVTYISLRNAILHGQLIVLADVGVNSSCHPVRCCLQKRNMILQMSGGDVVGSACSLVHLLLPRPLQLLACALSCLPHRSNCRVRGCGRRAPIRPY